MTRALAFLDGTPPAGFAGRLARLRWMRAAGTGRALEWKGSDSAAVVLGEAESWLVVRDPTALPIGRIPEPRAGEVVLSAPAVPETGTAHTLRELEAARLAAPPPGGVPAAIAFGTPGSPAPAAVTIEQYIKELHGRAGPGRFPVFEFSDPSELERPDLTGRLPAGPLSVLDAGCGAGGLALAKARNPGWRVTGIERDPVLAGRARERCDRVLEGDLSRVLAELAGAGERFEALVFGDVLEHLDDPWTALAQARAVAAPGARLVASVPNVGHLSIVRDLLLGRFDPVPAGLCDAGHLRWFTRASLEEAIEEAGWTVEAIATIPGAPAREPEAFVALARAWPDADLESLGTYQWLAVASAP